MGQWYIYQWLEGATVGMSLYNKNKKIGVALINKKSKK